MRPNKHCRAIAQALTVLAQVVKTDCNVSEMVMVNAVYRQGHTVVSQIRLDTYQAKSDLIRQVQDDQLLEVFV